MFGLPTDFAAIAVIAAAAIIVLALFGPLVFRSKARHGDAGEGALTVEQLVERLTAAEGRHHLRPTEIESVVPVDREPARVA